MRWRLLSSTRRDDDAEDQVLHQVANRLHRAIPDLYTVIKRRASTYRYKLLSQCAAKVCPSALAIEVVK